MTSTPFLECPELLGLKQKPGGRRLGPAPWPAALRSSQVPSPAKPLLTAPQPDASDVTGWLWPESTAQAREALLPYQCLSRGFLGEAVPPKGRYSRGGVFRAPRCFCSDRLRLGPVG